MREIKFKVWDKEKKRMSEPFYLGAFALKWGDGDIEMPVLFANTKSHRFTFLQYTEFKDSKDREVYDGDRLSSNGYSFTVIWDNGSFKSVYKHPEDSETLILGEDIDPKDYCIVGNIYNND